MAKVTHLYTGRDGESHFEDIEIPLKGDEDMGGQLGEKAAMLLQGEIVKATGVMLRKTGGNYTSHQHNASHRQFAITLKGDWELEVGDGTKRRFGPGDILLAEDTTGRGHNTRNLNNQTREMLIVTLD